MTHIHSSPSSAHDEQNLLESIAADASQPILQLNFIDAAERDTVLHAFNKTEKPLPAPYAGATIHGLFEHWVDTTPNAPALSYQVCVCV